jgi:PhnB protein
MVMNSANPVFFAPELFIPRGTKDISFYINAFNAVELRRWMNEDGSIHVAELSLSGAMFHLHEETKDVALFAPSRHQGSTALIGLFVHDVDSFVNHAQANGAKVISPPQSYDYGYRQAVLEDPFGHRWMVEKKI